MDRATLGTLIERQLPCQGGVQQNCSHYDSDSYCVATSSCTQQLEFHATRLFTV